MSSVHTTLRPLMSRKSGALQGCISVPGDKSISHRALILGALAQGKTEIAGLLEAEDILATAGALKQLGAQIEKTGECWVVTGSGLGGLSEPEAALDFGNSGTGARLMMGIVTGHPLRAVFTGDASLQKRPMGRVLDPLKKMGLAVEEKDRNTLPLTLLGASNIVPIRYRLPVPSAQVKSAILLAGLLAPGRTTVVEAEKTRDHTERMVTYFGGSIVTREGAEGLEISLEGQTSLEGGPVSVPGDPSSAAFLVAAAILCEGSAIVIENVLINPTRTGFYTTLLEMGADIAFTNERDVSGETVADIKVRSSRLKAVRVPAARAPSMIDEYPILSVLAAFAEGETVMEGLSELRVKESDRLAAIVSGLRACRVEAKADGDNLHVRGAQQVSGGATVTAQMDHRIAMSFLILGLAADRPVIIDDATMIATSFPEFRRLVEKLGGSFSEPDPLSPHREKFA